MISVENRTLPLIGAVIASLLFVALLVPVRAFALTVSGTVAVAGGNVSAHPIRVQLYESDSVGGWMFTDYFTETTNGSWSIDVGAYVPPGGAFKVVFDDQPYNWYRETAYPDVVVVGGDPSAGVSVAPGAGGLAATMSQLPPAFAGRVVDSKTSAGIPAVTVTAYEDNAGAWVPTQFSTYTDASGNFELRGLPAGGYRLVFADYSGRYDDVTTDPIASPNLALASLALVHTVKVERIAPTSSNFWSQPVNVAKRQYRDNATLLPDYEDVQDIVIASGDARAQADPLAAAGLCWAYQVTDPTSFNAMMNAPLLLVSSARKTDASVLGFIRDVAKGNGGKRLTIHIVGGTGSVPDARFTEISKYLVANGVAAPAKDRIATKGDRFTLARDIALRMKARADAQPTLNLPGFVLVANGADPAKFFDPLALSPIAAANGAPILLVSAKTVPAATYTAISKVRPTKIYVGGGSGTVTTGVLTKLKPRARDGVTRIWGKDRYLNSIAIANYAINKGWLFADGGVGVAATITDAQLAGVLAGNEAAPLLVNSPTSLNRSVRDWLKSKRATLARVYVVGSTKAVSTTTYNGIKSAVAN